MTEPFLRPRIEQKGSRPGCRLAIQLPSRELYQKIDMDAVEQARESEFLTLSLPPLAEDDPFFAGKKRLLNARELKFKFLVPLHSSAEEVLQIADQMVQTARILCMNEKELYFAGDDDIGPFSPRNEIESLNLILVIISSSISNVKDKAVEVLQLLRDTTIAMVKSVGDSNIHKMIATKFSTDSEELLLKWGKDHGVRTKLKIAYFEEAGRGAVASEDMSIGDIALEIPVSLIISEDLVYNSDMFDVLKNLDGITSDTMLLLWSMRERFNPNSKFKIYFDTLPEKFNTGLSFGVESLTVLEGTLLLEELLQSKEHIRKQFDALFPALCDNYPNIFQQELYSWDKFLWACELWYSNSMKVVFADGKLRTCLVPVAGFLNHSLCPHILHYGRVDPASKSLKFPVSRPCEAGDQCCLSYGSFPASHLIMFYGFLPEGDNPYDVIPLDFDAPEAEDGGNQPPIGENVSATHMVRGTWLSKVDEAHAYGLPPRLLAHLRALLKADCAGLRPRTPEDGIDKDVERNVLEMILSIFEPMLEGICDSDNFDRNNSSWDVKLSLDYKDLQRRIISSTVTACNCGLQMLEDM
ncbi:SET domain containing protein [Musa troglodytarum]|uniref:SET domain containing protein n=1 Tax=Musa troglodytarum TaxID=320322 RepID=A0A9E7GRG0_9LILI|nr:SET domain containing protein [Musa troglodytarum]